MSSKKGSEIEAAAQDLRLDIAGLKLSPDAQRAIQYGEEAAKRYLDAMRKQGEVMRGERRC